MCDCKYAQQYLFDQAFLMEHSGHSNENFFREKKTFKKNWQKCNKVDAGVGKYLCMACTKP